MERASCQRDNSQASGIRKNKKNKNKSITGSWQMWLWQYRKKGILGDFKNTTVKLIKTESPSLLRLQSGTF